ncbi:uncharacterized protein LOC132295818 [Cornus florida]|uniref:uncharacterized protein LOC132295818 n=1 Tax=Cornus florida TaxID=4283 RepID=UPI00289BEBA7|nr:uncharacterized protein LOC132295818 [Cornus florida]
MAQKGKKGKQLPYKKEATTAQPWPVLPLQLISLIAKQSSLMQNISFGGVTKSWRAAPKQCSSVGKSPWLQLSGTSEANSDECQKTHSHILSISFRVGCYWWYGRWPYEVSARHFVGYSQGALVVRGAEQSQYYLWNLSNCTSDLPPWDTNVPFKSAALSSSPFQYNNGTCIVMVITGLSHPTFVFNRRGSAGKFTWIKQDCALLEPHAPNKQLMQFTNIIAFEGKFYALSLQGTLAVIEDIDSLPRITALSRSRAAPSASSRHFREYLVESNGEILLIFLISKSSINIVDDVEVFGLDVAKLSWVKVENLGDRTFFVSDECCMFVTASKVGCRGNCIYFTRQTVDGWWLYDMERGSISPGWSNSNCMTKSPVWEELILE